MGWKSRFLFLLIVYFSGFATAIYYLAPSGRTDSNGSAYVSSSSGGSDSQSRATAVLTNLRDNTYGKVAAKMSGMNQQEFKAAFDRGMQAVMRMAKNGQSTASEGGEDK
jgi:hypothetical protein